MSTQEGAQRRFSTTRGLNLANVEETSPQEIAEFRSQILEDHDGKMMYPLNAYSFLLQNRPDMLKYHFRQLQQLHVVPGEGETSMALTGLTMLHWYTCNRVEEGVIHEVRICQRENATKAQLNEVFGLAFMHSGPSGFRAVYDQAFDYIETYREPVTPMVFPPGWAPDPEAFSSGLDFSVPDMRDEEQELLCNWYTSTIGYVPRSVAFMLKYQPAFMKAHRGKFEGAMTTGALPKQIVPYILIHYNMNRGFREGIREATLLGKAWGMTRDQVVNAVVLGAGYMAGLDGVSIVDEAIGDILESWT